jgi:competence protein ComGC
MGAPRQPRSRRGFTLLTLLAILAVMAILSAILFPQVCQHDTSGCQPEGAACSSDAPYSDVAP